MVSGTTVAVRLGMALRRELQRLNCTADLVDDTQDAIDRLIVYVVQHNSSQQEKVEVDKLCDVLAQVYSTASGVAWETSMRQAGVYDAQGR